MKKTKIHFCDPFKSSFTLRVLGYICDRRADNIQFQGLYHDNILPMKK